MGQQLCPGVTLARRSEVSQNTRTQAMPGDRRIGAMPSAGQVALGTGAVVSAMVKQDEFRVLAHKNGPETPVEVPHDESPDFGSRFGASVVTPRTAWQWVELGCGPAASIGALVSAGGCLSTCR